MSYTTVELVRTHLASQATPVGRISDQAVTLRGTDYVTFADGPVEAGSVRVKSNQATQPQRVTVSFTNGSAEISAGPIVPGSVIVAGDSSFGVIFTENRDYIIDHPGGTMHRKDGGQLTDSATVVVWFTPYTLYAASADFLLDASGGRIRRTGDSNIADGETVLIDYEVLASAVTADILDSAVAQANALVASQVDPTLQFGADPVLEAAATYRALEVVAYSLAARELSSRRGDQQIARTWLTVGEQFAARATDMIKAFRPPTDRLTTPVHT